MFNFKKNILLLFVILFLLSTFTALTVFIVDPMQHYRKATLYKPYSFEERYMAWGMLKHYEFDSVLIGTSVTENFTKNYVDKNLKLNILRVPFAGASAYEENLLMEEALKNKKLTTILYGLDIFSFQGKKNRLEYGEGTIPYYLKNNTLIDDYKYLLNIDIFFVDNSKIILSNYFHIKPYKIDYNKFWNWHERHQVPPKECINAYKSLREKKRQLGFKPELLKSSFNANILPHIQKNQNVKFVIFFPPYSILNWKLREEEGVFNEMLKFKKYLLNTLVKYDNVILYDFQDIKEITHNRANYIDPIHYSSKINRWIIEEIKNNNHQVKKSTINFHLQELEKQVKDFKSLSF